jgi:ureidoglycolate lyase
MRLVHPVPLDPVAYRPYGAVVRAGDPSLARSANHGTALAWDALAVLENARGARARASASLFRCRPLVSETLVVERLERHPESTQLFAPLRAARWLLVVARGGDEPALDTLAAFVVEGPQAITYAPGIWHHPMVALDEEADFVNIIYSDGGERDCDERALAPPSIEVAIPPRRA